MYMYMYVLIAHVYAVSLTIDVHVHVLIAHVYAMSLTVLDVYIIIPVF